MDKAARKAAHKKMKKVRQAKLRLGAAFIPQEQYKTVWERTASARHGTKLQRIEEARLLPQNMAPADCHINNLSSNIAEYLASPSFTVISKDMDMEVLRAGWYNNLDLSHCFDLRKSKIAAANAGLVQYSIAKGQIDSIPSILIPFAIACHEHRILKIRFSDRDAFIEAWKSAPPGHDLVRFSRSEVRQFNKMVADLRRALPPLDESNLVLQEKGINLEDLKEVLADDCNDLDDEGEKMAGQVFIENETGENSNLEHYDFESFQDLYMKEKVERRPAWYCAWVECMLEEMVKEVNELIQQEPKDKKLITAFYIRIFGLVNIRAMRDMAVARGYAKFAESAS